MTTEEAIQQSEAVAKFRTLSTEDADAIRAVIAALREATAERDHLLSRWPGEHTRFVEKAGLDTWKVWGRPEIYPTKAEAVWASARPVPTTTPETEETHV